MSGFSRRDLLKAAMGSAALGLGGSTIFGFLDPKKGRAFGSSQSSADRKFVLYVHMGSADGLAAGLLQPNSVGNWPSGCFVKGQNHILGTDKKMWIDPVWDSVIPLKLGNPLMMEHHKAGAHILHHYAKPLIPLAQNLVNVTCNPRSLDHGVARIIQQCGASTNNPHWISGVAQTVRDVSAASTLVVGTDRRSNATPDVAAIKNPVGRNLSIAEFQRSLKDDVSVPMGVPKSALAAMSAVGEGMYREHFGPGFVPLQYESSYRSALSNLIEGIPGLAETDPSVISLRAALSEASNSSPLVSAANATWGTKDTAGILASDARKNVENGLVLAGALAKSGGAYGLMMNGPGGDAHFGGSQDHDSRGSAKFWLQLQLFWNWIAAQGLENNVLVIITHEFSRTPFTFGGSNLNCSITQGSATTEFNSPGTDHHPVSGLYFLSGLIKNGGRYGGVLDGYTAAGSKNLNGLPDASVAAPSTLQAVGTMLFKLFPEFTYPGQESSPRKVREMWPQFKDSDLIMPLMEV